MQNKNEKILVVKLGALGDFVQSLGPMNAIRNHHKNSKITLLTTKPFVDMARQSGYFDEIKIDVRPKFYNILQWFSLKKWFNSQKFKRIYDLQNNDRTQIYFNLFTVKPEWVGVAKGASHRNTSKERISGLAFYGHKNTLSLAGITNVEIDKMDWIKTDLLKFKLSDSYALIVPGCAPTRPEKRWPLEKYTELCRYLIKNNIQPVLIGTDSEFEILDGIEKNCVGVLNLCGKTTLFDLVSLARKAQICVGNDTGPMHMAAPTGCKTVILFSKYSNPKRHAPLGSQVRTIQVENLSDLDVKIVTSKIDSLVNHG